MFFKTRGRFSVISHRSPSKIDDWETSSRFKKNIVNHLISTKRTITLPFISLKSFVIQIQKYGRTDQLKGLEPFHFDNWISSDNTYINKHTQTRFHTKRPHTITKMNDNIYMDSTMPGSIHTRSWVTTGKESIFSWLKTLILETNENPTRCF